MANLLHDFNTAPTAPRKRSKFVIPYTHTFTYNLGDLVPFYCAEVLPGDTFTPQTNYTDRLQMNPVHPFFGEVYHDIAYFFVPSRILYYRWGRILGTDQPSEYSSSAGHKLPWINIAQSDLAKKSAATYLGLKVYNAGANNIKIENPLPLLAYLKIWDEYYRNENLQSSPAVLESYYWNATDITFTKTQLVSSGVLSGFLKANKYRDLFTSCLPAPQKGVAQSIPVFTSDALFPLQTGDSYSIINSANGSNNTMPFIQSLNYSLNGAGTQINYRYNHTDAGPYNPGVNTTNLYASANLAGGLGTINDLRLAIANQRMLELYALGGTRYTEYIRTFFHVEPKDASLQRPEFLGGSHKLMNLSQVASTSGVNDKTTANSGVLGAYSLTCSGNRDFYKSFEEHGYVIGVMVSRVRHTYAQGCDPIFFKGQREDYYNPCFDRIGEVALDKRLIYSDYSLWSNPQTLGFQEAWFEYRHKKNDIDGDIAPDASASADQVAWNPTDYYTSAPTLSSSWVEEDKTRLDSVLVSATGIDQFICEIAVFNTAMREMSLRSTPSSFGL